MPQNLKKIGLGTVQWGAAYGIANRTGKTHLSEVATILDRARSVGVAVLDTASLYGDAEKSLGAHSLDSFKVVTKTPRFDIGSIGEFQAAQLRKTFFASLHNLGQESIDGLLLHNAQDLLVPAGKLLLDQMQQLKQEGRVRKIGVSAYDSHEIDAVLQIFTPDIIQLPVNVLDQRLIKSGHLKKLKDLGVEIHVRSVFLQGLLLMPLETVPPYFASIIGMIEKWHNASREQGISPLQAALSFIRDLPEVDTVLVGVETCSQFEDILKILDSARTFDATGLACDDPRFVNPALWSIK